MFWMRCHIQARSLLIEPLQIEELPRREKLGELYGIGRGEAACLVLSERMLYLFSYLVMRKLIKQQKL